MAIKPPSPLLSNRGTGNRWRLSFISELITQIAIKESRDSNMPHNHIVEMVLTILAHDLILGDKSNTDEVNIFKSVLCGVDSG